MDTLPHEVLLNIASFEQCAYELSLLSKTLRTFVFQNFDTRVLDRTEGDRLGEEEDESYDFLTLKHVYALGLFSHVRREVMEFIECRRLWDYDADEHRYTDVAISNGFDDLWDEDVDERTSVSKLASYTLRCIKQRQDDEEFDGL